MNATIIENEFATSIRKRGMYKVMRITYAHQRLLRYHLKKGVLW